MSAFMWIFKRQVFCILILITIQGLLACTWSDNLYNCGGTGKTSIAANAPAAAEHVNYAGNSITDVPDGIFDHLYQLKELKINNNHISSFPNLTNLGDTLQILDLSSNYLTYINPSYLDPLCNLRILLLWGNALLRDFPLVQGVWTSLQELSVARCDIQHAPDLRFMAHEGFKLKINHNSNLDITTQEAATMRKVAWLDVDATAVRFLATPCTMRPGALTVWTKGSTIKMCDCSNSWLKQVEEAGGTVMTDDAVCADGRLWSSLTLGELLAVCSTDREDGISKRSSMTPQLTAANAFCAFPLHSLLEGASIIECHKKCMATAGCQSYNFLADVQDPRTGRCVIVAPSAGAPVSIADPGDPGWMYYIIDFSF